MVKITEFSIHLDSNQLVYYPGQHVSGHLTLNLSEPMEMRGLRLKFCGEGYCNWAERSGTADNRRTLHFTAKRDFVEQTRYLFGTLHAAETEKLTHPAGRHTYKFSFKLPSNIPSSFEGTIGYVRYILKGRIDKPWKFDHKVKRTFTVNDVIDANIPMYLKDAGGEHNKVSGCLFCTTGPVELNVHIDRTCYCPGEAILIDANVSNMSSRDVKGMYAKLTQIVIYHVNNRGKSKTITKEIARIEGPVVPRGKSVKWEKQPFGVMATQPTITNCSVVNVHYVLEVVVSVPWGANASVKIPIVIGTIPYVTYDTTDSKHLSSVVNFPGGMEYTPLQPADFGYPNMPPPSYTAIEGYIDVNTAKIDKDQYTHGNLLYTPVYTFAKPY